MTKQERIEAKKAKTKELQTWLKGLSEDQRQEIAAKMGATTIEGRVLSPVNQCLVFTQYPNATILGGYQQWQRAGKQVKKGSQGIAIWIPTRKKAEEDGEEEKTRFFMVSMFDISQTEEMEMKAAA